jgi:hypothetical protein
MKRRLRNAGDPTNIPGNRLELATGLEPATC